MKRKAAVKMLPAAQEIIDAIANASATEVVFEIPTVECEPAPAVAIENLENRCCEIKFKFLDGGKLVAFGEEAEKMFDWLMHCENIVRDYHLDRYTGHGMEEIVPKKRRR